MKQKATAERAKSTEKALLCALSVLCVLGGCSFFSSRAIAQSPATARLAVLQAEDRRAQTPNDLAVLRAGARADDAQTRRVAIRALGRLERPSLIPDITPGLRHALREIRSEAANAIGQAAQGWKRDPPSAAAVDAVVHTLAARLAIEADGDVRATICESVGRLPYATAAQVESAERTLLAVAARGGSVSDRLGVAKGIEALVRIAKRLRGPGDEARALLRHLATAGPGEAATGARVRRLAMEALISAAAMDDEVVRAASHAPDLQVRRLAMRAAAAARTPATNAAIAAGLSDGSPIVRLEALRAFHGGPADTMCAASVSAAADGDMAVLLVALDQLADCSASAEAEAVLVRAVTDLSEAASPRGWHGAAHGLVALAAAFPTRGSAVLPQFSSSRIWQLRLYAARAAATLKNRDALETLAKDEDDNVREAAVEGLRKVAAHASDEVYVSQLTRKGNQIVRAAALALDGTPRPGAALPALKAAWQRLIAETRDNSHDARDAIAKTLTSLGAAPAKPKAPPLHSDLNAEDLRRLAAPRARVTIRGVGTFELALFTAQAPAAVLRFAHLAASGFYNGLTFHRVVPNFVIQGGSPGANEYIGDASFMRDEVGLWPHVRGAVGISTRGRDTGDGQIFIDLVDNPRLDHESTVFAQVLNGIDVVDRILEGDVIETIEILP